MAMGGGSTMRAAVKVTSLFNSRFRGGVVPETPITTATRAVSGSIGAISINSSSDGINNTVPIDDRQSSERYSFGGFDDDWDFIGSDEERRIFGAPPTIDEAKAATDELKDALEKIFVSSPRSNENLQDYDHSSQLSSRSNGSLQDSSSHSEQLSPRFYGSLQDSSSHSSQLSVIEGSEEKVCLMTGVDSTPKHAIQAFKFLDQSPEVQGVVASIASDPKVWEAVLRNPALQGYIQSQSTIFRNVHGESLIEDDNIHYEESPGFHEEKVKSENVNEFKDGLQNIWENIKVGVVDMMTNMSDFFNSLFGVEGDKKDGKNEDTSSSRNSIPAVFEKFLGPSMMGVVVLVIMVVVLKRV